MRLVAFSGCWQLLRKVKKITVQGAQKSSSSSFLDFFLREKFFALSRCKQLFGKKSTDSISLKVDMVSLVQFLFPILSFTIGGVNTGDKIWDLSGRSWQQSDWCDATSSPLPSLILVKVNWSWQLGNSAPLPLASPFPSNSFLDNCLTPSGHHWDSSNVLLTPNSSFFECSSPSPRFFFM